MARTGIFWGIVGRLAIAAGYELPVQNKRSFNSAQVSNLTSSWTTTPKPIDTDIRNGLRKLKARARHEAQNNDHVRRFLALVKTNVIGHQGVTLRCRFVDSSGADDPIGNKAIEDGFIDWGRKGSCDVTGKMSWKMSQRLYIENIARDGEVLIRRIRNWSGNKYGYAIQFLDTELLDVNYNGKYNGNNIRMGVELNEWRRPVAYHLMTTSQTAEDYLHMGQRYIRIPAEEIIHEFLPEWVWQTRGFPWMSAALLRLNMLQGYEDSELVASRVGASKMGFFEQKEDAPFDASNPVPPMGTGEKDASGNFVTDAEPGTFEVLPEGYTFSQFDPQHPSTAFGDFVKAMLRAISAGLGVPYNSLANDLEGVNLSTMRHAAVDERSAWMALQDWVVESFHDVVYQDWLETTLLRGAVTVAGGPLRSNDIDKYRRIAWKPRRWPMVDPDKEMKANEKAFDWKTRSPQQVIMDQGGDPAEVLDEWAAWQKMLEDRKLPPSPPPKTQPIEPASPAGSSVTGSGKDDEENEDD